MTLSGQDWFVAELYVKYLKGQPSENLQSYFPTDYFYIERKVSETSLSLKFALASPLDLEGIQIPKRVITQNHCVWRYRGDECGYQAVLWRMNTTTRSPQEAPTLQKNALTTLL